MYSSLTSYDPITLKVGLRESAVDKHYIVKGPKGGASTVAMDPGEMVYSTL